MGLKTKNIRISISEYEELLEYKNKYNLRHKQKDICISKDEYEELLKYKHQYILLHQREIDRLVIEEQNNAFQGIINNSMAKSHNFHSQ